MTTIITDTNKVISHLQTKGYTREMAEGFLDALSEIDETKVVSEIKLETALHRQTRHLYTFMIAIAAAQTGLTVALIQLLN